MKKYLVLLVALMAYGVCFAQAQANEKYVEKLEEMFSVSGSTASYEPIIDQMFKMIEMQSSETDKSKIKELKEEMKKSSIADLTKMLAPIYVKYLSIEDIDGMIAFYKTPVGKKYAVVTPKITAESVAVGQQWGMQLANKIQSKLSDTK